MADFTANNVSLSGNPLSRAVVAVWDFLVEVGETSARARALKELSQMTDAELEARGFKREELAQRLFGTYRI